MLSVATVARESQPLSEEACWGEVPVVVMAFENRFYAMLAGLEG